MTSGMQARLDGRRAVVVGATGALGRAVCAELVAAGAEVAGLDRSAPDGGVDGVSYTAVDVLDDAALGAWFDSGPAPWAVCNVVGGFAGRTPLTELDPAVLRQQLELNLVTAALLTRHALRRMTQAGEGRLVHTASRAAVETAGSGFAYSVSKAGVLHLVAMAARELRGTGVTVNAVVPSIMDTPANRAAMPNSDHAAWPKVEQVAAVYRWLVSPEAGLVTGAAVPVSGLT